VTPSDRLISAQEGTPEVLDELAFHEIDQLAETEQFNNQVLQYYQAQAKGRRSTLIFSKSVRHVNGLVTMMQEAGIQAKAVVHNTTAGARQDNTASFENGELLRPDHL
jgi:ATP-dependent helicase IRC3